MKGITESVRNLPRVFKRSFNRMLNCVEFQTPYRVSHIFIHEKCGKSTFMIRVGAPSHNHLRDFNARSSLTFTYSHVP